MATPCQEEEDALQWLTRVFIFLMPILNNSATMRPRCQGEEDDIQWVNLYSLYFSRVSINQ
jgi:hypothetical protein